LVSASIADTNNIFTTDTIYPFCSSVTPNLFDGKFQKLLAAAGSRALRRRVEGGGDEEQGVFTTATRSRTVCGSMESTTWLYVS
jgi:hypothetical protein